MDAVVMTPSLAAMGEPQLVTDYAPFRDARGSFQKIYRTDHLEKRGISDPFRESFVSFSAPGVLRGMHFQSPPRDHWKLVSCIEGAILDVCLDLRAGATYGQARGWRLDAETGHSLLIPPGFAHGFVTQSTTNAGVLYLTTREHDPAHDHGVRWDSFGFAWPIASPLVSDRDRAFSAFGDFRTPFAPAGTK